MDDTPVTGVQPDYAPRLPVRIIPADGSSQISALTLSDTIACTQRILTYVSYEIVHGVQAEFSDLRCVEPEVKELAKLKIDPFEEGSFVIPTSLLDKKINIDQKEYSGQQVLSRFVDVMNRASDHLVPISLGLMQAIEDLGKITRREARVIEYHAQGISGSGGSVSTIEVNQEYIKHVKASIKRRRHTTRKLDELKGLVTAIDLIRKTFNLKLNDGNTVRGSFESLVERRMIENINEVVEVCGVVESINNQPHHIRAYSVERIDESSE